SNTTTETTAAHWDWKRRALTVLLEAFVSCICAGKKSKATKNNLLPHSTCFLVPYKMLVSTY
ncbi:hypothetical protein, partial [Vibrio cholerae]|uniref:hypothetical protein n=1 Tax=Vibrio cholerae TaxID=666 RepID=UPI001C260798